MSGRRILCLGAGEGWHANQLAAAAERSDCELRFATYESLRASVDDQDGCQLMCEAGAIEGFDAVLTRTMPAGSLEQITFRLAMLHALVGEPEPKALASGLDPADGNVWPETSAFGARNKKQVAIVNSPRSLEIAIDKFATLAHVTRLGYSVPDTIVAQSRSEAVEAFAELGGDCIVKPIFGGEGRGVMRIRDAELAWTTFTTLENLDAICYVQRFVPPGGIDSRLLVIGDKVIGVRRRNHHDFRTNTASGAASETLEPTESQVALAKRICRSIGLKFASVDLIESGDGEAKVLEVNAIPGWKGAQDVTDECIAELIIGLLIHEAISAEARC
jgi:ribosomal protein S6--L-glutamate ligase